MTDFLHIILAQHLHHQVPKTNCDKC